MPIKLGLGCVVKKIGMTNMKDKDGNFIPITILQASKNIITKIDNKFKKIQVGSWPILEHKLKLIKKSYSSMFLKQSLPILRYLKEFSVQEENSYKLGDNFNLDYFNSGDKIKISGLSIGKGTQGNIKRHGFKRGPMSHGSKHHRLQGSLGAGTTPGRVFPGKKMSGKTGYKQTTIYGLNIVNIDLDNNILYVKGSTPGKKKSVLVIQKYSNV